MPGQRTIFVGLVAVSLAALMAFPLLTSFYLAPAISRLVAAGVRAEAERAAAHLAEPFFDASGLIPPEQLTPAFREAVVRHLNSFSLERIKVFAPSGEIVFSDDPAEEGKVNTKPYFREVVASGRTHTTIVRRDGRTQEGRKVRTDVVESYVPVMRDGRFAGALEVYYDVSARTAEADRFIGRLRLAVFAVAVLFLATVASLSLRAEKELLACAAAAPGPGEERQRPG